MEQVFEICVFWNGYIKQLNWILMTYIKSILIALQGETYGGQ